MTSRDVSVLQNSESAFKVDKMTLETVRLVGNMYFDIHVHVTYMYMYMY